MAFKKGQSGNPAGRKPGTSQAAKLRQAIEDDLPDIIQSLVDAAKAGDTSAAKLLLDRAIPTLKPEQPRRALNIDLDASRTEQARQITQSASDGLISPDEAIKMLEMVGKLDSIVNPPDFSDFM